MKEALVIFAKNTEAGKVKTRLAATIGEEAALAVYYQLLSYTASITNDLSVDKFVFYSGYIEKLDAWDNNHYFKQIQQGNDLGERMQQAFETIFEKGYREIVIIGTDCHELQANIISKAFTSLDSHDVVIGPAADGGYYLLGMKQPYLTLFENISWSTNTVFYETILKCKTSQLDYCLLPILRDIDREEDLQYFKTEKNVQHYHTDLQ